MFDEKSQQVNIVLLYLQRWTNPIRTMTFSGEIFVNESTPHKDAIRAYIGGYIVRKLSRKKDRGDLLTYIASGDVMKILKVCEVDFEGMVSGNDFENPKIINNFNLNYTS